MFAVRLDTFPADKKTQVFYIGSNNPDVLEDIRYILSEFKTCQLQVNICTVVASI